MSIESEDSKVIMVVVRPHEDWRIEIIPDQNISPYEVYGILVSAADLQGQYLATEDAEED